VKYAAALMVTLLLTLPISGQTKQQELLIEQEIAAAKKEVSANPNSAEAYHRLGQAYLAYWYSVADKAADAFPAGNAPQTRLCGSLLRTGHRV